MVIFPSGLGFWVRRLAQGRMGRIARLVAAAGFILGGLPPTAYAKDKDRSMDVPKPAIAYFAGGCFWCVESEFAPRPGVVSTRVGYSGGSVENPSYEQVSTGQTGHAETVEVVYDPARTSYEDLVRFFLTAAHDPTQRDRQGVDVGPQYRSAIFYLDEEQKRIARQEIDRLDASGTLAAPVVTEVSAFTRFWVAEAYHQKYYDKYQALTGKPHIRALRHMK